MVNCDHAAPPLGTHYVCEDPQNPCRCRLVPDEPKTPPGDFERNSTVPDRRVWIDPRRKIYYCSEKKPARLPKRYLRLTEPEARRRGYKPAPEARCKKMQEGHSGPS